ncbi:hypothetical protein ACH4NS_36625 [Streptomyces mutabilis]|jgi:hypothetical protein|uniref:hypothetical protein n=1 Tax=Streptomyces mutabilis TaxID=67332 RepID=UPI000A230EE3|nr:hypothetical protein [Streptomyces sp. Alain-F2R5]OSC70547.1 hypothetical protein B5181_09300 [Streptomyces sp. 4F]PAN00819.1 hypothetical protein CJI59_15150 [Streptomyces sp. Alain-F2R5]
MNAYERAARRALATTGLTHLTTRQFAALLDRIEEATPHAQHLQRLHPVHATTRDRLHAAGMTCAQIGLHDDGDPEFLDALLHEIART